MNFDDTKPSLALNNVPYESQNVVDNLDANVAPGSRVSDSPDLARLYPSLLQDNWVDSAGNEAKDPLSTSAFVPISFGSNRIPERRRQYETRFLPSGERLVPVVTWILCPAETASSPAHEAPQLIGSDTASTPDDLSFPVTPQGHTWNDKTTPHGVGKQELHRDYGTEADVSEYLCDSFFQQGSTAPDRQCIPVETTPQAYIQPSTLSSFPDPQQYASLHNPSFRDSGLLYRSKAWPFPGHLDNHNVATSLDTSQIAPLSAPRRKFASRVLLQRPGSKQVWELKDQDLIEEPLNQAMIQDASSFERPQRLISQWFTSPYQEKSRTRSAVRSSHAKSDGSYERSNRPKDATNLLPGILGAPLGGTASKANRIRKAKVAPMQSGNTRNALNKRTKREECRNHLGQLQGVFETFGGKQRTRKSMSPAAKRMTAIAKSHGVCPLCHQLKQQCRYSNSKYMPCDRCFTTSSILKLPCKLPALLNLHLIRYWDYGVDDPKSPLNFLHSESNWLTGTGLNSNTSREIDITHDLGVSMSIKVCENHPIERDTIAYSWKDQNGIARQMTMPHICVTDREHAKRSAVIYAQRSISRYWKAHLPSCDALTRDTFIMASISKDKLVEDSLMLWSACRMTEKSWRLCQPEIFGLTPSPDPANPWFGTVPVTPIMDQQLDEVFQAAVLMPLQERVLREMDARLSDLNIRKEGFLNLLLSKFILLNNLEAQNAHDRKFASQYCSRGRFWGRSHGCYPLWESRLHSAKTMLAQFHHVCQGPAVLRSAWQSKSEGSFPCGTSRDAKSLYLKRLKEHIDQQGATLQKLRANHRYEENLFWAGQLFTDCWEPDSGFVEISDEEWKLQKLTMNMKNILDREKVPSTIMIGPQNIR